MKHLLFETGGRPLNNDDFVLLQDEIYYAIDGQFLGLPACVVYGCEVTGSAGAFDIAPGLVYIDGEVRRFEGVSAVALPQELYTDAFAVIETRAYQTGGSKQTIGEAVVLARPYSATTAGSKVLVQPEGVLRVAKAREALVRSVGDVKMTTKPVLSEYDTTGLGVYGTKAFGWRRANGQGGTVDARGRSAIGASAAFSAGATGGADSVTLDITNVPSHTHAMDSAGAHTHYFESNGNRGPGGAGREPYSAGQNTGNNAQRITTSNAGSHTHNVYAAGGDASGQAAPFSIVSPWFGVEVLEWVGF